MQHRKSASNAIAKLKQLLGNGEQNISSNWKLPSNSMKKLFKVYNRIIEQQQMSA